MAKTAQVKWVDKFQFMGIDSSKHAVVMSSQDEENAVGMSPSQLLLVALGGCTSYDVVSILQKKREPLIGLEVTVTAEQEEELPRPYRKFHVHYAVRGRGIKEKAVRDAIRLSEEKYCSVAATLRGAAEVTFDYTVIQEE